MRARAMGAARVHAALSNIERAQEQLDDAAQALSAMRGFAKECSRLLANYDDVGRLWHAVDARLRVLGADVMLGHDPPTAHEVRRWANNRSAKEAANEQTTRLAVRRSGGRAHRAAQKDRRCGRRAAQGGDPTPGSPGRASHGSPRPARGEDRRQARR